MLALSILSAGAFAQQNAMPARVEEALSKVAVIHGNAGAFAVAGYRMGERSLTDLGMRRGSFDLEVVHETPFEVQWSCVADGLQAATGASAGKLNLRLVETPKDRMETIVRNRKTGKTLVFRLTPDFLKKYLNLPYDKQSAAARDIAAAPDERIFSVEIRSGDPVR